MTEQTKTKQATSIRELKERLAEHGVERSIPTVGKWVRRVEFQERWGQPSRDNPVDVGEIAAWASMDTGSGSEHEAEAEPNAGAHLAGQAADPDHGNAHRDVEAAADGDPEGGAAPIDENWRDEALRERDGGVEVLGVAIQALRVPTQEPKPGGYLGRVKRIDLNIRTPQRHQQRGLGRLIAGLRAQRATLANGRPVWNANDAIRWVLEKIGECHEAVDEADPSR